MKAEICQHNDGQFVIRETSIFCPCIATMRNRLMAVLLANFPPKPVRVRAAVIEFHRGPHCGKARFFDDFSRGERVIRFHLISDRRKYAEMRGKLNLVDASDVDELAIKDGVSSGAVLHDRPLIENGS